MQKSFMKMRLYRPFMAIMCTICLIQGCDVVKEVEGFFDERNAYVAPPAPEVTVAQPMRMDVTDYVTFTGTTKASESVNLAARVTGSLQSTGYTEGDVVKQGDLLFTIEPSVYEAKVAASKANLASQKAVLSQAKTEYDRAYRLYRANAGSDTDLVKWREARASAQAGVDMAEAELTQAEINLGYTQVRAPFDGRVGLWKVDVGNLVGPDSGVTNLGTIIRYAPMYAYFSMSERDVDRLSALRAERGVDAYKDFPVELSVGAGPAGSSSSSSSSSDSASSSSSASSSTSFTRQGVLDYGDLGIDSGTGTYLLRGVFPNDDGFLLPGMFVRVRFVAEVLKGALVIPMKAVSEDQAGQYVLVVKDHVAERRGVVLGPVVPQSETSTALSSGSSATPSSPSSATPPMPEQMVVVRSGLTATDTIITVGLMRARAGSKVSYK